jgi:16S rRNA (uracil1498-N3)-methyltransferase
VSAGVPAEQPLVFVTDLDAPELEPDDHHHLLRVLRLRPGDPITVSDGAGGYRSARLGRGSLPEVEGGVVSVPRPLPAVGVGFALLKGDRPELVVQKLTELGVDEIRPFTAARSVVRWDEDRRARAHQRLERVAREAAMQSRRVWLPTVATVATVGEVAATAGAARADRGGGPLEPGHRTVLVGPEGGWSDEERALELPVVGLADGVLRAETAAIVAGALLTALRAQRVAPASGTITRGHEFATQRGDVAG